VPRSVRWLEHDANGIPKTYEKHVLVMEKLLKSASK
jgi:hypothetical protein